MTNRKRKIRLTVNQMVIRKVNKFDKSGHNWVNVGIMIGGRNWNHHRHRHHHPLLGLLPLPYPGLNCQGHRHCCHYHRDFIVIICHCPSTCHACGNYIVLCVKPSRAQRSFVARDTKVWQSQAKILPCKKARI